MDGAPQPDAGAVSPRHLPRGLIVSCQAPPGDPFDVPALMAAFAVAAAAGGAVGIRANGVDDIRAIKDAMPLPILGLFKVDLDGTPVRITPTREHALRVAEAGADIIAVDATRRPRPRGEGLGDLFKLITDELGLLVCADIATVEEAAQAASLGAAFIATTLAGHTEESSDLQPPALELIAQLAERVRLPILAEGGILTPEDAVEAMSLGAYGVVVGTAITRPEMVTRRFASPMEEFLSADGTARRVVEAT
jgi:N-acylglucosamine-6-phosphate 2-epimerase